MIAKWNGPGECLTSTGKIKVRTVRLELLLTATVPPVSSSEALRAAARFVRSRGATSNVHVRLDGESINEREVEGRFVEVQIFIIEAKWHGKPIDSSKDVCPEVNDD